MSRADALRTLKLLAEASWPEIKVQYRKLVVKHNADQPQGRAAREEHRTPQEDQRRLRGPEARAREAGGGVVMKTFSPRSYLKRLHFHAVATPAEEGWVVTTYHTHTKSKVGSGMAGAWTPLCVRRSAMVSLGSR